jgi:hypothetical protein
MLIDGKVASMQRLSASGANVARYIIYTIAPAAKLNRATNHCCSGARWSQKLPRPAC